MLLRRLAGLGGRDRRHCSTSPQWAVVSVYWLGQTRDSVAGRLQTWLAGAGATGRLQVCSQGVNCQLCLPRPRLPAFHTELAESLHLQSEQLRQTSEYLQDRTGPLDKPSSPIT